MHDQFVVAPINQGNKNVAFICKQLYNEVLIKKSEIEPDNVSKNSNTYNAYGINDQLIINQYSE